MHIKLHFLFEKHIQRAHNVETMSIQRCFNDVESTLNRRCLNVVWSLGQLLEGNGYIFTVGYYAQIIPPPHPPLLSKFYSKRKEFAPQGEQILSF